MLHQETNEYGVISVDNNFLNQLIKDSLKPYEGKAWQANYKGKSSDFLIKLGNIEALAEKTVRESEEGVYVRVYLLVKFGQSLGTIANSVIDGIADALLNDLDLKINNIEVVISGVMMTKGIVKRNIVYSYKNDGEEKQ